MLFVNKSKLLHMVKLETHTEVVDTIVRAMDPNIFHLERNDAEGWTMIVPKAPEGPMPVLTAHTDTVFRHPPKRIDMNGAVWSSGDADVGLGADDRAGCYIIKELVTRDFDQFIYMIFDKEEIGCVGSSAFSRTVIFDNISPSISCFIGLDRMGIGQVATYGYDNETLLAAFEMQEGWGIEFGSYTDVAVLAAESGIACVNLSVGYMYEHTKQETLDLSHLGVTLNLVANLDDSLWGTMLEYDDEYYSTENFELNGTEYYFDAEAREWTPLLEEEEEFPPDDYQAWLDELPEYSGLLLNGL